MKNIIYGKLVMKLPILGVKPSSNDLRIKSMNQLTLLEFDMFFFLSKLTKILFLEFIDAVQGNEIVDLVHHPYKEHI